MDHLRTQELNENEMKKSSMLLLSSMLITMSGCTRNEHKIIREVSYKYIQEYLEDSPERVGETALFVKELSNYEGYNLFQVSEELSFNRDTLAYSYHFKYKDVFVFVCKLNGMKRKLSENLYKKLFIAPEGFTWDPYIYYLALDPKNNKYLIIEDNQRYLGFNEWLEEVKASINSLK